MFSTTSKSAEARPFAGSAIVASAGTSPEDTGAKNGGGHWGHRDLVQHANHESV